MDKAEMDKIIKTYEGAINAFKEATKTMRDLSKTFCFFGDVIGFQLNNMAENKRVVHLAIYARKWRTRKKNRNRLHKILTRKGVYDLVEENSDERD